MLEKRKKEKTRKVPILRSTLNYIRVVGTASRVFSKRSSYSESQKNIEEQMNAERGNLTQGKRLLPGTDTKHNPDDRGAST